MLKNAVRFVRTFIDIFNGNRLTRAAAALSYYMTMTFFPVVIVLYTLLGNSYDKAMRIVAFAENLMAEETVSYIRDFLGYVAANNSTAMMIAPSREPMNALPRPIQVEAMPYFQPNCPA